MTAQTIYAFRMALRQIGLWLDDDETRALAERLLREAGQ